MNKTIPKEKWIWMPHPAHFICSSDCKFFLATKIGKYIVSTVGEYFPDSEIREIFANSRGVILEGKGDARRADYMKKIGFEDIGYNRKYETMVFKARKGITCKVCPFVIDGGSDIDFCSYNEPNEAYEGHLKMCKKWANKK